MASTLRVGPSRIVGAGEPSQSLLSLEDANVEVVEIRRPIAEPRRVTSRETPELGVAVEAGEPSVAHRAVHPPPLAAEDTGGGRYPNALAIDIEPSAVAVGGIDVQEDRSTRR